MPFQNQLTREEVMLIFIKILAVRKQQKQFKYQAGIFFLLEEFFGALLCILVPTTPEPWKLKAREVTFTTGLRKKVKLEQKESVWEEVVVL